MTKFKTQSILIVFAIVMAAVGIALFTANGETTPEPTATKGMTIEEMAALDNMSVAEFKANLTYTVNYCNSGSYAVVDQKDFVETSQELCDFIKKEDLARYLK